METEIMIARDRLLNVIAKYHSNHDWDSVLRAVDDYTAFMAVAPAFIFKEVKHDLEEWDIEADPVKDRDMNTFTVRAIKKEDTDGGKE